MTCCFLSDVLGNFDSNKGATQPKSMTIDQGKNIFPADGVVFGPGYHPSQEKPQAKIYKNKLG